MYGSSMPLPATEAVSSTSRAIGLTANESQIFLIMSRHSASLAGAIASICTVVLPAPELPITASSSPLFATPVTFFSRCLRGLKSLRWRVQQLRSRVQSGSRGFPSVGASPNTSISFQV
uniref:Uncharacterized protein n=1 Tax=Anopheles coluzzii TaxID=1518534 RepID=A0A8W7PUD3_ANOCL